MLKKDLTKPFAHKNPRPTTDYPGPRTNEPCAAINVFDEVEVVSTGQRGKVKILIGMPAHEALIKIYPAANGCEIVRMWDEEEEQVELAALNRYPIEELKTVQNE